MVSVPFGDISKLTLLFHGNCSQRFPNTEESQRASCLRCLYSRFSGIFAASKTRHQSFPKFYMDINLSSVPFPQLQKLTPPTSAEDWHPVLALFQQRADSPKLAGPLAWHKLLTVFPLYFYLWMEIISSPRQENPVALQQISVKLECIFQKAITS